MNKFLSMTALWTWTVVMSASATPPLTSPSLGDEGSETVLQSTPESPLGRASVGLGHLSRSSVNQGSGWRGGVVWFPSPNTTNATAWAKVRDDALVGLKSGGNAYGDFIPITVGNRTAATILPNGGFQVRAGFWLETEAPFYPSNILYSMSSSDKGNKFEFEGVFSGLSISRHGLGIDGYPYTEGNPLVTNVWGTGVANGFRSDGANDLENIAKFLESNRPWSVRVIYKVTGTDIVLEGTLPFNFLPPSLEMRLTDGRPRLFVKGDGGGTLQVLSTSNPLTPRGQWEKFPWVHQPGEEEVLLPFPVTRSPKFFTADWLPNQ